MFPFFPISYWVGPPQETPARYAEIAECGMTLTWRGDPDLSAKEGLQCLVADARVDAALADWNERTQADLDAAITQWKDHPAFYGFYLRDEPNAADFPALARVNKRILELAPNAVPYINLFPTYASAEQLGTPTYEEHVERFMEEVRPRVLSYDHYALMKPGDRADYFRNMEIIRAAGLRYETPFWFILLTTPHYGYRNPTEGEIRWQVYTALAYGAKGIMYFTYLTPNAEDFQNGILDPNGKRTEHFDHVRRINREIRALAPTLNTLTSVEVVHSEPLPDATRPLREDAYVRSVTGGKCVLGFLRDADGGYYLFLVNRDYRDTAAFQIAFADSVTEVSRTSAEDGQARPIPLKDGTLSLKVDAGGGALLRIHRRQ